jgi:hypothetical protein
MRGALETHVALRPRNARNWEAAAALALVCLALYLGRPAVAKAFVFPDSAAYIDWPADFVLAGPQRVMGARPVGYALFLDVFGTGAALVWAQTILSLGSWSVLGWLVARLPGVVLGCLLALLPSVWRWNASALSESLSLSLLALGLAAALALARRASACATRPEEDASASASRARRSLALFAGWVACVLLFGWSRDANLILLPALLLPALYGPLRGRLAVLAVGLLVLAGGAWDAHRNERTQWSLDNAILARVLPDPTARARFAAAGMPIPSELEQVAGSPGSRTQRRLRETDPAYLAWTRARGGRVYWSWVLTRPASYGEAWGALERCWNDDLEMYPPSLELPAAVRGAGVCGTFGPGPWVAWLLPFLWLAAWRRGERRLRPELAAALLGSATALVSAFATYHADGVEVQRHMLLGIVLQRAAAWIGVAVLATALLELVRARRGKTSAPGQAP